MPPGFQVVTKINVEERGFYFTTSASVPNLTNYFKNKIYKEMPIDYMQYFCPFAMIGSNENSKATNASYTMVLGCDDKRNRIVLVNIYRGSVTICSRAILNS